MTEINEEVTKSNTFKHKLDRHRSTVVVRAPMMQNTTVKAQTGMGVVADRVPDLSVKPITLVESEDEGQDAIPDPKVCTEIQLSSHCTPR